MEIFLNLTVFIIGLCVGSFINMLQYRTAVRYKLVRHKTPRNDIGGRSFCDFCGRQLEFLENVPLASWLIQKGKSRCCGKKLPTEYPLVELGMGILFLIFNLKFEIFNQFLISNVLMNLAGLVMLTMLVFSAVFDLKYMILPDFSTVILTICAAVLLVFQPLWYSNLWSAIGSGLFIGSLHFGTRGRGMGFGDVKLAPFMGLILGFPKIILAYYIAFIVGSAAALFLIFTKKLKMKSRIAFGPFLILGTIVAWVWGETIIRQLLSLMY